MRRQRQRGFSLVELSVTVAIFGVFLLILTGLAAQMARFDRMFRIELMTHPQTMALLSRVGRDVRSSVGYPGSHAGFEQSPATLLLTVPGGKLGAETVVYDFSREGEVKRLGFRGDVVFSAWSARGTGRFEVSSFEMPDERVSVRLGCRSSSLGPFGKRIRFRSSRR